MTRAIDLRVVELLAARLCHDLISPVSAIANGAELLTDEEPEFMQDAVALVGDSARKANRRLQFYRFAFGFSGGGLAGPPPHQLAAEFFAETSVACEYAAAVQSLPIERQKLACLMLAVAAEALPRGGRLLLKAGAVGLEIDATGEGPGPSPQLREAIALAAAAADLTSRTIGAYFAGLVADSQGVRIVVTDRPGGFQLATAAL